MEKLPVPFERSYWVEQGKFLAGCYPGDKNPKEAQAKLEGLLASGIRVVVNLMEEDELGHNGESFVQYEKTLQQIAKNAGTEVDCSRMPIQDLNTPQAEFMVELLDCIDQAISENKPVFVHCWGGKGRTGTVVGCYLARHGKASGQDVLLKINELRKNDPTYHQRSPETERQRDMVKNWRKRK
jgi:protein tyrosine/serine phosphatase